MGYEAPRRVETSARTFVIIEHLDHVEHARISTIARELEMSKGIVHNHVSTLRELGYVTKRGPHYQLSAKLVHLGRRVRSHSPLYRAATSALGAYADRVDTGVLLIERAGQQGIVIDSHRLPPSVALTVGSALPMAHSLPGVVVLTMAGEAEEPVASADYDLESVRAALDEQGYVEGTLTATDSTPCLAAPLVDDESCYGALAALRPPVEDTTHDIAAEITTVRAEIEAGLGEDRSRKRSFATEKHAWIDS